MSESKIPTPSSPSTPTGFQIEWLMIRLIDIQKDLGEIRAEIEKLRTEAADRENRILKWAIALVPVTALALLKIWDLIPLN